MEIDDSESEKNEISSEESISIEIETSNESVNESEEGEGANIMEDREIINIENNQGYFIIFIFIFIDENINYCDTLIALVGAVGVGKTALIRSSLKIDTGTFDGTPISAVGTLSNNNNNDEQSVPHSHTSLLSVYKMNNGKSMVDLAGIMDMIRNKKGTMHELNRMIKGYMSADEFLQYDRKTAGIFAKSSIDFIQKLIYNTKYIYKLVKKPLIIHGIIIVLSTIDNLLSENDIKQLIDLFKTQYDIQGISIVITHKSSFGERESDEYDALFKLKWLNKTENQNKTLEDYKKYLFNLFGCKVFCVENYESDGRISLRRKKDKEENIEEFKRMFKHCFDSAKRKLHNLNLQ